MMSCPDLCRAAWRGWGAALLLALVARVPCAQAEGDTLYGALVMATNAEHPAEPPEEIRGEIGHLQAVFGYNQFAVVGQKRKTVVDGTEDWLVSSPKFFLRVDTVNAVPGGYALGLQLFREKKALADAQVKLTRGNPLFIRGPLVAQGQLIIVLTIL